MATPTLLFRPAALHDRVSQLDRSARCVGTFAQWLSFYQQDRAEAKTVAAAWRDAMARTKGNAEQALCLVYVAHEVCLLAHHAKDREKRTLAEELQGQIPPAVRRCVEDAGDRGGELRREVARLAGIWKDLDMLSEKGVKEVQDAARAPITGKALVSTTSRFSELIQVSKRLVEAYDAQAAAEAAAKRRRLSEGDACDADERLRTLSKELDLHKNAQAAHEALKTCVSEITARLDTELEAVRNRRQTLELLNQEIDRLEADSGANGGGAAAADDAYDQVVGGPKFRKGERVWYFGKEGGIRATVMHVPHGYDQYYQIKRDGHVQERNVLEPSLKRLTDAERKEEEERFGIAAEGYDPKQEEEFRGLAELLDQPKVAARDVAGEADDPPYPGDGDGDGDKAAANWTKALMELFRPVQDQFSESVASEGGDR